jgi:hypothetical protein
MRQDMKNRAVLITLPILGYYQLNAQVYTNKEVGNKNQDLIDSLKNTEYPYSLPIWGAKATKKGYNLPYSAGIGINYFWQKSDLVLNELMVGFNNGPMYNLDEIVRFNNAVAEASAVNIRPDIWVFPFLNVYAILGKANTSTSIDAGVWIPDTSDVWKEVSSLSTKADFNATMFGIGITPTMGVGGGWIALDMNVAWTDVSALNKPVFTYVFGPRAGKTFKFKKPERNIAFWAGGFRVKFSSSTEGSINLADVLPVDQWQSKVDDGLANIEAKQEQVDTWWNDLSEMEQNNPSNKAKYETINRTIDAAGNILTAADGAVSSAQTSTVQYSLQKNLKDKWNFIVGSQLQINKSWMLRAEYGFLGSRQQFIGGLQFRFGL